MQQFSELSGLELNMEKSEFMWIGERKGSTELICGREPAIKMKVLGVMFSAIENCAKDNQEAVESKIRKVLDQWSQRNLTIKGKIAVARYLIASQLTYIMAATRIANKFLALIQSHLMKFVCGHRRLLRVHWSCRWQKEA